MSPHNIFFFGAAFFLVGVLLASVGLKISLILIGAALISAALLFLYVLKKDRRIAWMGGLVFLVFVGALYFIWDDKRFQNVVIPFGAKTTFEGLVVSNPEWGLSKQDFKIALQPPRRGNILVRLSAYPRFRYGDLIRFEGVIQRPEPASYASYLAKERVSGFVNFPKEVRLIASNRGSPFKARLFELRNKIVFSFQQVLPVREAALLSGLTLGSRSEFSKEFKEAMARSGTTHLVALSGYNITIIAWAAASIFLCFLSRRLSFALTVLLILGFVMMTGAEASVVRAGLMGILVLLAKELGRLYNFRNAIIFAALAMAFVNPKVLVFDAGFQLSFLALLGIIYLKPALGKIFKWPEKAGFLGWRENLTMTLSAQLAVAPILIASFNNFSLTALFANVLVLEAVPVTMGLGFVVAAVSFISYHLALALGWAAWLLLRFEILVIEFFSKLTVPITPTLSAVLIFFYYAAFIVLIAHVQRINRMAPKT
jgi:competence protein ComEC